MADALKLADKTANVVSPVYDIPAKAFKKTTDALTSAVKMGGRRRRSVKRGGNGTKGYHFGSYPGAHNTGISHKGGKRRRTKRHSRRSRKGSRK